ncbi:farnesyl-diphosphate farnesyl transferase [Xylariomycetidae sp. FL0641]|nr:farnesyl-diphosphate farnesyl transferase [Xylariomycetidae sp. FL0641]
MLSAKHVAYNLFHPQELFAILQWKLGHRPIHARDVAQESSNVNECYRLLGLTSRSFVTVVQELHPELLMPVVVFYLVLRALDTVEDDMTIDIAAKEPLLRDFHTHLDDEPWTFNGSGPNEKDREALVKFNCVAIEFNKLKKEYRLIIKDIAQRMGNGMADYARRAHNDPDGLSVRTIQDYEQYCHYVAGLEDYCNGRYFWPQEVWSKYVGQLGDLLLSKNREKALQCSSEMVILDLDRARDCLSYIEMLKEQSTFNFVAIPQAMALITRGAACQVMMASTQDFQTLCEVFCKYVRRIQRKNNPSDPHFNEINRACDKVQRFAAARFPTLAHGGLGKGLANMEWVLVAFVMAIMAIVVGRSFGPGHRFLGGEILSDDR